MISILRGFCGNCGKVQLIAFPAVVQLRGNGNNDYVLEGTEHQCTECGKVLSYVPRARAISTEALAK